MRRAAASEVEAIERDHWKAVWHNVMGDWRLYVMLIPMMFFLICWKYLPIASMVISFKNFQSSNSFGGGVYTSLWIGLDNYRDLFAQSAFWSAFRNTFALSFYSLVFGFPFPIILALFFSEIKNRGFLTVAQVLTYLPRFISVVIVTNLVGLLLRTSSYAENGALIVSAGPIGWILENWFGQHDVTSNPGAFRAIYIISGIWETGGYSSIVYFAAILGISPTYYEAAKIDGANKMQQLRYVTIPGMAPTLVIMLILRIGQLLSVGYEKVWLLQQQGAATVLETGETVATYVINVYMGTGQGIGAAADMFNSLLSMVLVLGSNKIARSVSKTSLF
jgi:putative aldouronate transport system permease protein